MISIIVPVYNAEKYLECCLESLLKQTFQDTEILLVDDGSTDGSGALCERFAKSSCHIRVFHTKNAGVSAARNRGIEESKGKYLSFVDADDWLENDMLEHLAGLLEMTGSDVAGCGFREIPEKELLNEKHGMRRKVQPGEEEIELLAGREFIEKGILGSDTSCCNKLFRRDKIGNRRFETVYTIGEDMLFLLGLSLDGLQYCRSTYKGYCYRLNDNSAMKQSFKKSYMDQIYCWQEAGALIKKVEPGLVAKGTAIQMISTMLVAGKLAIIPPGERKKYGEVMKFCRDRLLECIRVRGSFRLLPTGYKLKTALYLASPNIYMQLYHFLKR